MSAEELAAAGERERIAAIQASFQGRPALVFLAICRGWSPESVESELAHLRRAKRKAGPEAIGEILAAAMVEDAARQALGKVEGVRP